MIFACDEVGKKAVDSLLTEAGKSFADPSASESLIISAARVTKIPSPTSPRVWEPQAPAGGTFRAALGQVTQAPVAGTFTVTFGGQTTSALAYNASASTLQTALNALSTISGLSPAGVVVTVVAGDFVIAFNALGNQAQITANATGLAPTGTIAEIGTLLNGTAGIAEVQTLRFVQSPAALADLTTASPAAAGTVDVVAVGASGPPQVNAKYRVTLYTSDLNHAYDGRWSITLGGVESGLIAWDASADEALTALAAMSSVGAGNVTVFRESEGVYLIGFQGDKAGTPMGAMTVDCSALKVVAYMTGPLDLRTPAIQLLFGGAATVTALFTIEYTPSGGNRREIFRQLVTLQQPLIAEGALTPSPTISFYTSVETDSAIATAISAATAALAGGSTQPGFANKAALLAATPAYIGQPMASDDGYFGVSFGTSPGQVTLWFLSTATNSDPAFYWNGSTLYAPGVHDLVMNDGAGVFAKGVRAGGGQSSDYSFQLFGAWPNEGVGIIRHTDPTGFSGFDCLEASGAGGFTVCFNNSGTSGEQIPRTNNLLSFFGISGAATGKAAPILTTLFGDYGSGAHQYRIMRIETDGDVKFFKLAAGGGSAGETSGIHTHLHPTGEMTIGTSTISGSNILTVAGAMTASGITTLTNATASTTSSTGALVVTGGVGVGGAMFIGGTLNVAGATALAGALTVGGALTTSGLVTIGAGLVLTASTLVISPASLGTLNNVAIGGTTPAGSQFSSTRIGPLATQGTTINRLKHGTATLVGGTVTIGEATITANTLIMPFVQSLGTVAAIKQILPSRVVGTSFTLTSTDNTDTSVVRYVLIEP